MNDKNEDELERLAREEIMKDAKRGAERAKDLGAFGWMKPSRARTNKEFLGNVLVSTLRSHKRKTKHSHDHDHKDKRRDWKLKRDDNNSSRYYDKRKPKLVNGGYFRYNDPRKYEGHNEEDGSHRNRKHLDESNKKVSKHRKENKRKHGENSDYREARDKEKRKYDENSRHRKASDNEKQKHGENSHHQETKDDENIKHKDKKSIQTDEKNNNNSEVKKQDHEKKGSHSKGDNSGDELVAENIYQDDTIKVYRKRKMSTEHLLIEDIKSSKVFEKGDNPEKKITDFVGDYLIDKKQKKKSKHKEKKSHKSKHKHKKHKHKSKKSSDVS